MAVNDDILKQRAAQQKADIEARRQRVQKDLKARGVITVVDPNALTNPNFYPFGQVDNKYLKAIPRYSNYVEQHVLSNTPPVVKQPVGSLSDTTAVNPAVIDSLTTVADSINQLGLDSATIDSIASRAGLPSIARDSISVKDTARVEEPQVVTPGVKVTKVGEEAKPQETKPKAPVKASNTPKGESLTDWMRQNKMGDKVSLAERAKIYKNMGINLGEYKGTATQNTALLKALKTRSTDKSRSKELLPLDTPKLNPLKVEIKRPNIPSKLNIKK